MTTVEILAIGNELLSGDTQDTSASFLCKNLTQMGGQVRRVLFLPDEVAVIVDAIESSARRGANVIFTIGGLGPTPDDLTLAGVAEAAGVDLVTNEVALDIVRRRYEAFANEGSVDSAELSPARKKMANIPVGSTPIYNPVGAAPAIILEVQNAQIFCLPGVPRELRGIFSGPLQEFLLPIFGNAAVGERNYLVDCKDESVLAPLIAAALRRNDGVRIKSRPSGYGPNIKMRIRISTAGRSMDDVSAKIAEADRDFRVLLDQEHIGIEEQPDSGNHI